MILKFYKLTSFLILFLCFSTLHAQPQLGITITDVDGTSKTSDCFDRTPLIVVSEDNLSFDVTFTLEGVTEPGSFVQIIHKYANSLPGTVFQSNNNQFYDPAQNGTVTFTVNLNNSVFDGDGFTFNFLQFNIWNGGFPPQGTMAGAEDLQECRLFFTLDAPMPVELTSFKGNETQKTNTLNWQTAAEINNDYFEVERSIDGRDFKVIGMEEGNGTTTLSSRYRFIDHSPLKTGYYRLRQVDFDGAFEYSDIIMVEREDNGVKQDLRIYPNPVKDNMKIEYQTAKSQEVTVSVMNMTGQILSVQNVTSQEGRNILDLNSADIPTGSYILRIDLGDQQLSKLFIK